MISKTAISLKAADQRANYQGCVTGLFAMDAELANQNVEIVSGKCFRVAAIGRLQADPCSFAVLDFPHEELRRTDKARARGFLG